MEQKPDKKEITNSDELTPAQKVECAIGLMQNHEAINNGIKEEYKRKDFYEKLMLVVEYFNECTVDRKCEISYNDPIEPSIDDLVQFAFDVLHIKIQPDEK